MKRIFISYASSDRTPAKAIHEHLSLYYDVFLDQAIIHAGADWEQALQESLDKADVVLALVSERSSRSTWVGRELAYADRLGKACIPALLSGQLPLRLAHLQYVDFSGNFEAALAELLDSIAKVAEPVARSKHDATVLLGSAVRSRLAGDLHTSATFIARAAALDSDISAVSANIWDSLATANRSVPDSSVFRSFEIIERTDPLDDSPYENRSAYRWTLRIAGSKKFLEAVAFVEYQLHPTFKPPRQLVRSRDNGFQLGMVGWGRFEVLLCVHMLDGRKIEAPYMLTFSPQASSSVAARAV